MHDVNSPFNRLDPKVAFSPEVVGKECCCCFRALEYKFFRRDVTYRDGRRDVCTDCESQPRLSIAEQTCALHEANNNSEAVKSQRWANQDDYRDSKARIGRAMFSSDFIRILGKLCPDLYFMDGRVIGDIAVFKIFDRPQPQLEGRTYQYLFYIPTGLLPEFSLYEFDEVRDIPLREKQRGWRTPLLSLIAARILTEETCNKVFGRPEGPASTVWHRNLYNFRNLPPQ